MYIAQTNKSFGHVLMLVILVIVFRTLSLAVRVKSVGILELYESLEDEAR